MYSFGHNREIATLDETDNYLEVAIDLDKGPESLKYFAKYRHHISLASVNKNRAVIRIHDLKFKDELAEDLADLAKIKCKIDIVSCSYDTFLHIEFSETPYKKCVKLLERQGLSYNKSRTKWWGTTDNQKIKFILSGLDKFKYLKIERIYEGHDKCDF